MLIKAKELRGYKLSAIDGELGSVKDFYFDNQFWAIRYMVANTGSLFTGRKVLISPYLMKSVDYAAEAIIIDLSKDQIKNSPELDEDRSVSRKYEEDYSSYYRTPTYWGGPKMWGADSNIIRDRDRWDNDLRDRDRDSVRDYRDSDNIGERVRDYRDIDNVRDRDNLRDRDNDSRDSFLKSAKDIMGDDIRAIDGEIGHVEDFIIDDDSWAIRYLILDTKDWLPGKKVLISPEWIENIDKNDDKVIVNLSRETIKNAPEYYDDLVISREFETQLFNHYNREGYWTERATTREYSHTH